MSEGRRRTGRSRRGTWTRRLGALVVACLSVVLIQTPAHAGIGGGSGGVNSGDVTTFFGAGACNQDWIWAPDSPITFDASCSYMAPVAHWKFEWDFNYPVGGTFQTSVDSHGFPVVGMVVVKPDGFATMTQDLQGRPTGAVHSVAVQLTNLDTGVSALHWYNVDVGPLPWPQVAPTAAICDSGTVWGLNVPITMDATCSTYDSTHAIRIQWDFNYNGIVFNPSSDVHGFDVQGTIVTKPDGYTYATQDYFGNSIGTRITVAVRIRDLSTGLSSVAVSKIRTAHPTSAPVAVSGGPYLGAVNVQVQFDARGSSDAEGDPLTYAWDFNNDGFFDDATGPTPLRAFSAPGSWPVAVEVTDHPDQNPTPYSGVSKSTVAYTTVEIGAHAPIAKAGGPYSVTPGSTVVLDGSASHDPDGLPITYAWDFGSGSGNFTDATGITADFSVGAAVAPGTSYTVCVQVSNVAKSTIACTSVDVVAPPKPPVITLTPTTAVVAPSSGVTHVQFDASRSYDGNGNNAPLSFAWSSADGGSFTDPTASITTFDVPAHTAAGSTFNVCVDVGVAGRSTNPTASSCALVTVSDDGVGPVLTVPDPISVEATGPSGAVVTYSASAVDAVDGPVAVTCTPASGSTFALGTTTVTCSASDTAGNGSSASFTVLVADTKPPVVTVPGPINAEATGLAGAAVSFTATSLDLVDGPLPVLCSQVSGSMFARGTTSVICSATDNAGNTGTRSFDVHVADTTPPVVTVPLPIAVEATGPGGAVVTYSAAALDAVDGSLPVTCTRSSGATFVIGTTTVTCAATDHSVNTAIASFTVQVADTTPPTVAVPLPISAEATGPGGAVVTYAASALDTVDGPVAVTCDSPSGGTFALGTTPVQCSATDAHGNTGTESFSVVVRDTTPPSLTSTASVVVPATGPAGGVATFTKPTATDLVDGVRPVTCDRTSGSTFAIGTTTVHCSASDTRGNAGTSSFTVHVEGASEQLTRLLGAVPDTRRLAPLRAAITRAISLVNGPRPLAGCSALSDVGGQLRDAQGRGLSRGVVLSLLADVSRIQAVLGCRRG